MSVSLAYQSPQIYPPLLYRDHYQHLALVDEPYHPPNSPKALAVNLKAAMEWGGFSEGLVGEKR